MTTMEVWRDIPDYADFYQASSFGRVRSLSRTVLHKKNGSMYLEGHILHPAVRHDGSWTVILSNEHRKVFRVRRLVWKAFHGRIPSDRYIVIDPGSTETYLSRLRMCTWNDINRTSCARRHNLLGALGVNRTPNGKYRARISVNGRAKHIGTFTTLDEAITARKRAELTLKEK